MLGQLVINNMTGIDCVDDLHDPLAHRPLRAEPQHPYNLVKTYAIISLVGTAVSVKECCSQLNSIEVGIVLIG